MLSHIEGASNREGLQKVQDLEKQVGALCDRLARNRTRHYTAVAKNRMEIELLEGKIADKDRVIERLQGQISLLRYEEEVIVRSNDREVLDAMQLKITESNRHIQRLEKEAQEFGLKLSSTEKHSKRLESENRNLSREVAILEKEMGRAVEPVCDNGDCPIGEDGDLDLCGRCIVFIGGRSNQTPHFRTLVERCNGKFMHHDGGLDDGQSKLESILSKADAVFFPVDCVSHNASRDIKRFCKRDMKPFIPLSRSGYATFRRGLEEAFVPQTSNDHS